MNKKKKISRLKHRKNRERMKSLIRLSRLNAKPKKIATSVSIEIEAEPQATTKEEIKQVANKTAAIKAPAKKPTAKKATVKKKPTKKSAAKKTTKKKAPARK